MRVVPALQGLYISEIFTDLPQLQEDAKLQRGVEHVPPQEASDENYATFDEQEGDALIPQRVIWEDEEIISDEQNGGEKT